WSPPWPPGMIRCAAPPRSSPARWQPRCNSASPAGSGPGSTYAVSVQGLAPRARHPGSPVRAVPAYTAFRCTPTPRSPPIAAISWNSSSAYAARGAVSLERLQEDANGDLVYTFTHPWSDGTMGIRLSPLELLEKLAALIPLPHVHLVRYGGGLAPHSHLRGSVIPTLRQQGV